MAKENVIKFYEQLKADKASAEALKAALASAKPADKDAAAGTLIAFARERGFEFSRGNAASNFRAKTSTPPKPKRCGNSRPNSSTR